jgi:hypothetical protein
MECRGDDATPAFDVRVDAVGDEFFDGGFAFSGEEVIPRHGVIDEEKPATFRGIAVDLLIRVLIAPVGGLALGFAEGGIHDLEDHFAAGEGGGDAVEDRVDVAADGVEREVETRDGVVDRELDKDDVGFERDDGGVDLGCAPTGVLAAARGS